MLNTLVQRYISTHWDDALFTATVHPGFGYGFYITICYHSVNSVVTYISRSVTDEAAYNAFTIYSELENMKRCLLENANSSTQETLTDSNPTQEGTSSRVRETMGYRGASTSSSMFQAHVAAWDNDYVQQFPPEPVRITEASLYSAGITEASLDSVGITRATLEPIGLGSATATSTRHVHAHKSRKIGLTSYFWDDAIPNFSTMRLNDKVKNAIPKRLHKLLVKESNER